jgi:tetratricopeptide (TPR) repeat protein
MNEEPKSIWKKSWPARTLFVLACFATLIALFYAEEDWRGWHAWQKFKHKWEANGERFDRASVIPPTVPDDQNFALTSIVASTWEAKLDKNGHQIWPENTNVVDRLQMTVAQNDDRPTNGVGNWQKSTVSDLKIWQQYYRALAKTTNEFPVAQQLQSPADDVLLALSKYDSAIEELRQASQMPYSRFPLNYDNEPPAAILLPHLAALRKCAQVLQLRAIAELQNGQSEKALADIKLMLRLADSVRTEPILISPLVRIAIVNLALQPVWEGLAEYKWSDGQLAELDRELAKLDFLSDYKLGMRGEMVLCQIGNIEYLRRFPEQTPNLAGKDNSSPPVLARIVWRLIPNGWFYQNELHCARMMVEQYLSMVDLNQRIVSPTSARHADATVEADTKHRNLYNIMEKMFLPSLGKAVERFANEQNAVDMARVACALERYRLAHGEYPKSLDALVPQFITKLPHDIIGGQPSQGSGSASQPLHYRRTTDDQFVLYSVGWNETDDDGEVGLKEDGSVDRDTGDWVWRYPSK